MKKLLYLLFMVLATSCAPTMPALFSYSDYPTEKTIAVDNNKKDLFVAANAWLVESFNDAESVVKYSDAEAGVVICKYLIEGKFTTGSSYVPSSDDRIFGIISIAVKDNVTKIKIVPEGVGKFYKTNPGSYYTPRSSPSGEDIKKKADELILDYEAFISRYRLW